MQSPPLFTDVEVSVREITQNRSKLHKHNFFELIYVLEGQGIHNINNNHFSFSKGDVFLLTPEDAHTFDIDRPTKFCFVDFTKGFFSRGTLKPRTSGSHTFFERLEYIFHNHHSISGNIVTKSDRKIFKALIYQLIEEKKTARLLDEVIIQSIVNLLFHFIARNIQQSIADYNKSQNPKSSVHEIISYIQQNIYDNELLKIKNLAEQFNRSADHLNRYFKSETGNTIKNYITNYKLNLIQTRLRYSELTISEIAHEMNFSDESHLNKTFKSVFGKTASQYKKEVVTQKHKHLH